MHHQVIHIHAEAPLKPALGAPCNGCGVCCLVEPCPVGMLISRRRKGACDVLVWSDDASAYRCGLLVDPDRFTAGRWMSWGPLRRLWLRWARRVIAAGRGCDADFAQDEP
ncbi:MAG: hypothetical protein Q7V20_07265 [Aquabacterium sp.]|uniref:hypothetical protein n=1 Tax=Aquabacterium sp. TaxID=1872578 RepID=UPI0027185CF6|nr:hypothetical protein [Aquabacterium sp.]MDO9003235.1 hypothetical protein [Aquabacterium sp.]